MDSTNSLLNGFSDSYKFFIKDIFPTSTSTFVINMSGLATSRVLLRIAPSYEKSRPLYSVESCSGRPVVLYICIFLPLNYSVSSLQSNVKNVVHFTREHR